MNNYNGKAGRTVTAWQGIRDRIEPGMDVYYSVGGIVCGEVGIVPIDKNVLLQTIIKDITNGGKR